uniref:T9SS type A sorting domain-containing protein n=1 Tax=candidate division WOR-3 bacterium TaxID=2052148 RepID=A0A7V0Z3R6_UNCW3
MNNKKIFAMTISVMLLLGFFYSARADQRWGNDVRIGNKDSIFCVSYDIHRATGNIFAALVYHSGDTTLGYGYFSSNGGTSWSSIGSIFDGIFIQDLRASVSVVANHFYVAHTFGAGRQLVLIRRFRTSNGQQENFNNGAQYIDIFSTNPGDSIKEIALVSDQDFDNAYLNLFAITTNGSLRYFYSDTAGINWYEASTGVTNARRGLDACTNEGYSNYSAFASYVKNNDYLQIDGIDWYGNLTHITTSFVGPNSRFISIGAYKDTVITVYEMSGTAVAYYCKYLTSYNGGSNWVWGIPGNEDTTYVSSCPDVAARDNGGQGIIYAYNSGSNRRFRYTWRDYYGAWSTPVQFGDYQPRNDVKPAIEYLGNGVYGSMHISYYPIYGAVYYDRSDWTGIEEANFHSIENGVLKISPNPSAGIINLIYTIMKSGNVKISLYDATEGCSTYLQTK